MTETHSTAGSPKAKGKQKGGALSLAAINLRAGSIQQMTDPTKVKRARRKLIHRVLAGIAAGAVKDPAKAAQVLMALMPQKDAEGGDED